MPRIVERHADRTDASVHHVRGRDDIAARIGLHQGLPGQDLDGLVVQDHAVLQQSVMAVAGERIERDIAQDADLGHGFLDRAHGTAHQVLGIDGLAATLVAQARIGIGKDRDTGDGELGGAFDVAHGFLDRQPVDTRHGRNRRSPGLPVDNEDRPDQVGGGQFVLAHHAAQPLGLPQPARPVRQLERQVRGRLHRDDAGPVFERATVFDCHVDMPSLSVRSSPRRRGRSATIAGFPSVREWAENAPSIPRPASGRYTRVGQGI